MNNEWVDFRVIKNAVSMQMLVDHYALKDLKKFKDELRGRCPIHKGDGERTFHVNLTKNIFQCFSCKAKGNVLDFVAAMELCNIRDAALKLQSWFLVSESDKSPTVSVAKPVEEFPAEGVINPALPFNLRVDPAHEYGLSRGLHLETLEEFGAGLCMSKGMFTGRFIIPLHNRQAELIGYAGRSIDDSEPRYLFPSSEKGFYKSHLLFNLHRVLESGDRNVVVIVEGFFSVMKLWQEGIASVSLLGSSLSERQEELLCKNFSKILLLFDGDEAGTNATDDCLLRLGRRIWVSAISLDDSLQPDQLSTETLHTLLGSL